MFLSSQIIGSSFLIHESTEKPSLMGNQWFSVCEAQDGLRIFLKDVLINQTVLSSSFKIQMYSVIFSTWVEGTDKIQYMADHREIRCQLKTSAEQKDIKLIIWSMCQFDYKTNTKINEAQQNITKKLHKTWNTQMVCIFLLNTYCINNIHVGSV